MKKNIDAMNHPTKVKETIGERIYTIVVYLLLILISATIILPLLHIISGSFSDPHAAADRQCFLLAQRLYDLHV